MSNIGMMEGAFFVGRKEIMEWINSTLELKLAKVEDTASGAVACQLLDIMYPGQVPMHKVNWSAKQSFEFVSNYKILQTCFTKLGIDRHIDVDRLIKGLYMDNLEFMQWFKRFFEMGVSDTSAYDAYGQRCKGKGGAQFGGGKQSGTSKPSSAPSRAKVVTKKTTGSTSSSSITTANGVQRPKPASVNAGGFSAAAGELNQENDAPNKNNGKGVDEIAILKATVDESNRNYAELRSEMEGIEKERDFYFEKLRDIEILMQELDERGQANDLSKAIFKILYATADGFEPVNVEAQMNPKSIDVEPAASTIDGIASSESAIIDSY